MNLSVRVKINIILLIVLITPVLCFGQSQNYTLSLDTIHYQDSIIKPQLVIQDTLSDSLRYDISIIMTAGDSTLVFRDTFEYHFPKVLAFDYIDLNYSSNEYLVRMPAVSSNNFFARIRVLNAMGVLEEEIILN